jgi:hypothetical protein
LALGGGHNTGVRLSKPNNVHRAVTSKFQERTESNAESQDSVLLTDNGYCNLEKIMGFIVAFVLALCLGIFWIMTIIDCAVKEPSEGSDKVVWLLIIIFLNWVGALIYRFVRRPQRIQKYGS